jgi:hypothetical protein
MLRRLRLQGQINKLLQIKILPLLQRATNKPQSTIIEFLVAPGQHVGRFICLGVMFLATTGPLIDGRMCVVLMCTWSPPRSLFFYIYISSGVQFSSEREMQMMLSSLTSLQFIFTSAGASARPLSKNTTHILSPMHTTTSYSNARRVLPPLGAQRIYYNDNVFMGCA